MDKEQYLPSYLEILHQVQLRGLSNSLIRGYYLCNAVAEQAEYVYYRTTGKDTFWPCSDAELYQADISRRFCMDLEAFLTMKGIENINEVKVKGLNWVYGDNSPHHAYTLRTECLNYCIAKEEERRALIKSLIRNAEAMD